MFKCRKKNIMKLHKTVNKNKGIKLMQFFLLRYFIYLFFIENL